MLIPVHDIPTGHKEFRLNSGLTGDYSERAGIIGQVACDVAVDRLNDDIFVKCSFTAELGLCCSRCMKQYTTEITCEYTGFFKKNEGVQNEDADGYYIDENDSIDLSRRIYEESVLMRPMKPLCSTECTGIKKKGGDSDKGDHIDPRWDKLKEIKKRMEKRK